MLENTEIGKTLKKITKEDKNGLQKLLDEMTPEQRNEIGDIPKDLVLYMYFSRRHFCPSHMEINEDGHWIKHCECSKEQKIETWNSVTNPILHLL